MLHPVAKTAAIKPGDRCPGEPWHRRPAELAHYFDLHTEASAYPLDLHRLSAKEARALVVLQEETRCLDATMSAREINKRAKDRGNGGRS